MRSLIDVCFRFQSDFTKQGKAGFAVGEHDVATPHANERHGAPGCQRRLGDDGQEGASASPKASMAPGAPGQHHGCPGQCPERDQRRPTHGLPGPGFPRRRARDSCEWRRLRNSLGRRDPLFRPGETGLAAQAACKRGEGKYVTRPSGKHE